MRRTKSSDSITQGPRMKAGVLPPSLSGPIVKGFDFTRAAFSRKAPGKSKTNSDCKILLASFLASPAESPFFVAYEK